MTESIDDAASAEPAPNKVKNILKWGLIIAVLVGIGFAAKALGIAEAFKSLLDAIEGLGIWGPVIFIAVYVIATVFFIPASVLTLGAGAVFGLALGSVYVSLASTLGASLAFLIGRYIARDKIAKKIEGSERFAAIDNAVGKEGWKIVGLTRLSPAFPLRPPQLCLRAHQSPVLALCSIVVDWNDSRNGYVCLFGLTRKRRY